MWSRNRAGNWLGSQQKCYSVRNNGQVASRSKNGGIGEEFSVAEQSWPHDFRTRLRRRLA
jgi:hypothetical protein